MELIGIPSREGSEPALQKVQVWQDALSLLGFQNPADQQHFEEAARRRPIEQFVPASVRQGGWQKPFEAEDDYQLVYIPSSPHMAIEMVGEDGAEVPYGTEGTVRVWRLTDDQLLPGFGERDRARRVKPYGAAADQFPWSWIGDPFSPEFTIGKRVEGVY